MSLRDKLVNSIKDLNKKDIRTITFDSDWQESMESLRQEFAGKKAPDSVQLNVPDELCEEICLALETHSESPRILYSETKIPINNVGESFRQNELNEFCGGLAGEALDWVYGFLMPEILNPFDKTAVAIYALKKKSGGAQGHEKFDVVHAGYLEKDIAKKVHKKVLSHLGKDQYIPLLIRMTGGTKEKPNYGAFPYVMSSAIKFE
jgi:hypothetical protein